MLKHVIIVGTVCVWQTLSMQSDSRILARAEDEKLRAENLETEEQIDEFKQLLKDKGQKLLEYAQNKQLTETNPEEARQMVAQYEEMVAQYEELVERERSLKDRYWRELQNLQN